MSEPLTAAIGVVGTVAGIAIKSAFDRYRNRDKIDASQAGVMMRKLWEQNKELGRKVEECERRHLDCEKHAARLEEKVSTLREDLEELRRRMDRSDLME